jgi:hypothetical protein
MCRDAGHSAVTSATAVVSSGQAGWPSSRWSSWRKRSGAPRRSVSCPTRRSFGSAALSGRGVEAVNGWEASQLVAGDPDVSRQDDVLRTGIAFHTAIADQPRPAFLDLRDDPWSIGDRIAWDELPVQACPAALDLLEPLINVRRTGDLASQVVHGDLPGNVLFADGLPPAIIDWAAYWRPTSWASAVGRRRVVLVRRLTRPGRSVVGPARMGPDADPRSDLPDHHPRHSLRTCRVDAGPGRGISTRDRPRRHLRQPRAEMKRAAEIPSHVLPVRGTHYGARLRRLSQPPNERVPAGTCALITRLALRDTT